MAEELRLVGQFQDNITPKLKKLDREIKSVTKSFTGMQKKLRPISKELGRLAMSSERISNSFRAQRQDLTATTQAMRSYTTASKKAAAQQRKMKPSALPKAPRAPMSRGRGMPMGGGGIGFGGMLGANVLGGLMTNAIIGGFRVGVDLMVKPFTAFASAFAERIGDEMQDIQSAGGMFALDEKAGTGLFDGDFAKARAMQERLNASLARSAAALPGATNDYVKAARGITDTVMMAFGKNEEAFKGFAQELGAREGATSEEAITKVLSKFTEQTVLLGMGGGGGRPLHMLMEQMVTMQQVNVTGMKARYAQLRSNPLLATMLEDAQEQINSTEAGSAARMKAVMEALDNALPQQVVNAMRRSMDGLVEATRSAFFDPDTGLFGLSRKIQFQIDKNGPVIEASVFELMRDIAANLMVPLMELLTFLPQIFDPFGNLMPILGKFKQKTDGFFKAFEGASQFFEDEATKLFKQSELATDPKVQKDLRRQANMLKEQAGARGGLATLNAALRDMGVIDSSVFKVNAEKLMNFDDMEFDFSGMATTMLNQFANSPLVADFVGMVGEVLGAVVGGFASALGGAMDSAEGDGLLSKLIDSFIAGFKKGVGDVPVQEIIETLMGKVTDAIVGVTINYVLPAILDAIIRVIEATWESSLLGKFLVLAGGLMAVIKVTQLFMALKAGILAIQAAMLAFSASGAAFTISGWLGAVGPALAAFGAAVAGAATAVGTFVTGTLLPALGTAASAVAAALAPILAVVGAVLLVVAVFRHLDFIIDSVAAGFELFRATMDLIAAKMLQGIGFALQKVSFGAVGGDLEESGKNLAAEAAERQTAAMKRIADNTTASLARTNEDFTKIGNMLGLKSDEELAEAQNIAKAANDTAVATRNAGTDIVNAISRIKVNAPAAPAAASYAGNTSSTMGLGAAIATENKNKPAGSHLVIANSSETVIPAFKGYSPKVSAVSAFQGYKAKETQATSAFKGYMDAGPAFAGPMAQSAYGGMGESNTTINFNPTINTGNDMNADELANLMAEKVLEAVQEATYAEVYTS
tara:strand:- start:164 stop:3286 length:3123 start_codon:yes stop_codon:yes gene_type:complete